ncbi:MAG TPA: 16S rRNA (cytosine(1402)-N(4))-methyltransferase RsmH [Actinomycetaceae bacterium]|nr:16S rRNA (cytosine(1402)-N(4))-methyltransferase RsmH [Actinomycetaceae bacterium]
MTGEVTGQDTPGGGARQAHVPVLAERCLDLLAPALEAAEATLLDATLGLGGHSELALQRFPELRVVGIDRDPAAIAHATRRLAPFGARFTAVHAVYDSLPDVAAEYADGTVAGILMDLGVSSMQLDEADRGFAYSQDAPLDMRMDTTATTTAADILNTADAARLRYILRTYGEERFASRIVQRIIAHRQREPLTRTTQLADLVREAIPAATRRTGGHPAKRTFQALRIAVNAELDVLADALPRAVETLAVGGRLVVMAYHSLEDRMVKRELARGATSSAPQGLPVELEQHRPYLRLLTRGAEQADAAEIDVNPRAASVRLRAAERLRPTPEHMRQPTGRVA